jgi:hypothetical protein
MVVSVSPRELAERDSIVGHASAERAVEVGTLRLPLVVNR